ncbi:MAG: ATPase [Methanobrevibacter sp.]
MNGLTIVIWIIIAIIGIVSIISVKKHYRGNELGNNELSKLKDDNAINKLINAGQNILSNKSNNSKSNPTAQLNKYNIDDLGNDRVSFRDTYEEPIDLTVEAENQNNTIKYESQNQVLIDYGNTVEKFQEPIKQSQMDIMTQNNTNNEKHELKDLFTIDELIKESKRKDNEREKEIKSHEEDKELAELKESIKQKKNGEQEDSLIEEIIENNEETINEIINSTIETDDAESEEKEETINDLVNSTEDIAEESENKIETPTITSQDIEEVINTASQESEEEVESISESSGITDVLLDATEEEIKEPILKTPTKVTESRDAEIGADNTLDQYDNDLDYRKDLAKITNTIKGSRIFQDVKEKLTSEPNNIEINDTFEENYIRNVNEYEDDFEPIINETHSDFEATYEEYHEADYDQRLRQENTQKVFNMAKNSPEPERAEPKIGAIKDKPSRDNIKVQINNNEYVIKRGDEIIFNHAGETYSSQVYAINGDDISVKYRRQSITIKPSDVKKVY